MKAKLINLLTDECVYVHSTTEHPDSSYGQEVLVDDNGVSYGLVGHPILGMQFIRLTELEWLEDNGYEMVKSIGDEPYWRCVKHNDDETTSLVWDDPGSEDAYDLDMAACVAYDIING